MDSTFFPTALYASTVLLAAFAYHVGFGNPPTPLPDEERAKGADDFPWLVNPVRRSAAYRGWLFYALVGTEVVASVHSVVNLGPLNTPVHRAVQGLCPADEAFDPRRSFPLIAWTGCLAHILGAFFREWAKRSLGRFYTWEVSLRPGHRLYTGGPYKIVRHPGYLGTTLIETGQLMFMFSGGTFTHECLKWRFLGLFHGYRLFVTALSMLLVFASYRRCRTEDLLLKGRFEKEWEKWAERTRFRLIPGIY